MIEEGFETLLMNSGRIAVALERIALALERGVVTVTQPDAKPEKEDIVREPDPADDGEEYSNMTAVELRGALAARGVAVSKRATRNSLMKTWLQFKDSPVIATTQEEIKGEVPVETIEFATPEPPAPPEPEPEPEHLYSMEEARAILTELYVPGTDREILLKALSEVGATTFKAVNAGDYNKLIAKFKELKNA